MHAAHDVASHEKGILLWNTGGSIRGTPEQESGLDSLGDYPERPTEQHFARFAALEILSTPCTECAVPSDASAS